MFCVHCGQEMTEGELFCTNCGSKLGEAAAGGATTGETAAGGAAAGETAAGGAATGETAAGGAMGRIAWPPFKNMGKWGGKVLTFGLPAVAIVLVVGVIAVYGAEFFMRTFMSPEKYFQHVVKKSAQRNAEILANNYDTLFKEKMNFVDRTVDGSVEVRLGDEARNMIELAGSMAGIDDFDWLKQAGLKGKVSVKDRVFSGSAALQLGKDEVLTLNAAADQQKAYLQVPTLSKKYIGVDLETLLAETYYYNSTDLDVLFSYLDALYTSFPEKQQVKKLLYKYFTLAISCIDEVEKGKETLDAGDVTEKCTTLETVIRTKTVKNMTKTVLTEMKKDEELKKILKDFSKLEGMENFYDEYMDGIDMMLDEVGDIELYENITLIVYVNGKGEMIGFRIKTGDSKFYYANPQKGSKVGYDVTCEMPGQSWRLKGQGKESGGKVDADFTLRMDTYYGTKSLAFRGEDLDINAVKKGELKGTLILPLKEVDDFLESDNRMLRRYDLTLKFDIGGSSFKADASLMDAKEEVAAVTLNIKEKAGEKGKIPGKQDVIVVENVSDFADWMDTVNTDAFINRLEKANLPIDIINYIEEAISYAEYMMLW